MGIPECSLFPSKWYISRKEGGGKKERMQKRQEKKMSNKAGKKAAKKGSLKEKKERNE